MNIRRRRALFAAVLSVLLLPAGAASAACPSAVACVVGLPELVDVGDPGGGGGSGVLCEYVKTSAPPPSDWTGDPNSPAPYAFTRTQEWGDARPGEWNTRACVPLCVTLDGQVAPDALVDCMS